MDVRHDYKLPSNSKEDLLNHAEMHNNKTVEDQRQKTVMKAVKEKQERQFTIFNGSFTRLLPNFSPESLEAKRQGRLVTMGLWRGKIRIK